MGLAFLLGYPRCLTKLERIELQNLKPVLAGFKFLGLRV